MWHHSHFKSGGLKLYIVDLYSPTHIQIQALHTNTNKEPTADLFVATELRGVEQRAVVEQLRD